MEEYARSQYEEFNARRKRIDAQMADEEDMKLLDDLENEIKKAK